MISREPRPPEVAESHTFFCMFCAPLPLKVDTRAAPPLHFLCLSTFLSGLPQHDVSPLSDLQSSIEIATMSFSCLLQRLVVSGVLT